MKILIATDGSECSKVAVEESCRNIIQPGSARVRIVSTFEDTYPMAAEPFAVSAEYYQAIINAAEKQAEQFADEAAASVREHFSGAAIDVSTRVLRGSPAPAIVDEARDWGAELIVVGSHGRGFWARQMIGSVSDAVIHHSPCSVLVVRSPRKAE